MKTLVNLILSLLRPEWYRQRQINRAQTHEIDPLLHGGFQPGKPAIVYFTLPNCMPCKTKQEPAFERLRADLGDSFQLIKIDSMEHPEDSNRWGVYCAPTTFVLDKQGQPVAVNNDFADEHTLKGQLQGAAG